MVAVGVGGGDGDGLAVFGEVDGVGDHGGAVGGFEFGDGVGAEWEPAGFGGGAGGDGEGVDDGVVGVADLEAVAVAGCGVAGFDLFDGELARRVRVGHDDVEGLLVVLDGDDDLVGNDRGAVRRVQLVELVGAGRHSLDRGEPVRGYLDRCEDGAVDLAHHDRVRETRCGCPGLDLLDPDLAVTGQRRRRHGEEGRHERQDEGGRHCQTATGVSIPPDVHSRSVRLGRARRA